jgi:hypothetical protein
MNVPLDFRCAPLAESYLPGPDIGTLEKTARGIELAQIQQRTLKLEYFAPPCCVMRDPVSSPRLVEMLAFSTAGSCTSRPATSGKIGSKEFGMTSLAAVDGRLKRPSRILRRTLM